jgi:hypothetical protein
VASLVLELFNQGTVAANGTATLTATATPPVGAPVRAQSSLRLHLRANAQHRATARLRFRVPDDWPAEPVTFQIVLEPDATLAATNRGGGMTTPVTLMVE